MYKTVVTLFIGSIAVFCFASEKRDFAVGIFSEKHIKDSQNEYEDRFCYETVEDGKLYAIFDGYRGHEVADFVANNFVNYFQKTSGSIQKRMINTFKNIDKDECIKNNNHCGSTGSVVFIKDKILHCAHVGDSRVLLEGEGDIVFETIDHKPTSDDECVRIEDNNGKVVNKRVNNLIPVSRAFGYYGFDKNKKLIIVDPQYETLKLSERSRFLVLATKGLWKVVNNEEVVAILQKKASTIQNVNLLAKYLVLLARQKGSHGDITVMVVDLLNVNLCPTLSEEHL